ncbi:hypothetical protein GLOIN_2v1835188 [Rhizophagus clarus]|uniref:Uncharacterized protein n=1 Tax=Rhizophagus clarus TaxID=94130 RepID=A0A8H3QNX9_9GLOM|nr:hypothetical protein GLOIN_2v1835188 [Rhizophagus clarus]
MPCQACQRHSRLSRPEPARWHDPMMDLLIDDEGGETMSTIVLMVGVGWNSGSLSLEGSYVINNWYNTNFMGNQCSQKFRNLVRDYKNFCLYRSGVPDRPERCLWSRTREMYYDLFRIQFWEKVGNYNKNFYL